MRYSHTSFCLWLLPLLTPSTAQSVRRLIVSGRETSISNYPFTVALLYCEKDWGVRKACAVFCSGSLIAPNVVLTAGHCVYDPDSAFGYPHPPTPISNTYVMVGSSDTSDTSQIYKVKSVINGGYSTNLRFPFDDDIGLVLLSECIELIPGQIETIKLATRAIDSTLTTCTSVTSTGYGRHENLPNQLFVSDGKVRVIHDHVHSFETCRAANTDAMSDSFGLPIEMLNDMIDSDKHLCAGGNTIWSTCNGDSGGPVFTTLGTYSVQVGVTSFGPSGFCGISPDYSARVSNYDSWIAETVSGISMCPGWSVDRIFEGSIGITKNPDNPTRCTDGYWQCPGTGECIAISRVCDGTPDCMDETDEDDHFCRMTTIMDKEPLVGALNIPEPTSPMLSAIQREFKALPRPIPDDLIGGVLDTPSFVVVGVIESVSRLEHSFTALAHKQDNVISVCSSPDYTRELTTIVRTDCTNPLSRVDAFILEHRESNPSDLSVVAKTCTDFATCVESSTGQSFDSWLTQLDECLEDNPRKFMTLIGSTESAISLCGTVEYFMDRNASRESYTAEFNQRYNSTHCSTLPEERLSSDTTGDSRSAITGEIMYRSFIALIIMYQLF